MKTEAGLTITENGLTRRYEYSNDFSNKRCFMWRDWLRDNLGIERVMLNCTSYDPYNELDPRDFDYKRDHNDYHPNLLYGYCFSLALYCRIYGEDPTEQNNGLLSSADIPGSTPVQKAAYMAMIKNMVKEQLEFAEAWPDVPDYPAPDPGPEAGKIVISNVNATAGGTVTVDVSLENNPGFSSFVATVNYDETRLILDSVSLADGVGGQLNVSRRIVWVNNSDYTEDGAFLTLTFTVKDDAADGDAFVFLSYDVGDISNYAESDVAFNVIPGIVTVKSHVPGDINGDNTTNSKDLTRLLKYLAGNPVEVNAAALDINGDGKVNSKDLTRLLKYLAGENVSVF